MPCTSPRIQGPVFLEAKRGKDRNLLVKMDPGAALAQADL